MIKIKITNNNINERKYILDIIFDEFLGLNYTIEVENDLTDYEIILSNNKILTIKDTFFNKFPKDLEYLKKENIPKKIEDLDIFSACFFMLTRWEEYVNKNRDIHNRFPATQSLAYKQGFLDRPIINEHVEKLKKELLDLDDGLVFKKHKSKLYLTHDVDNIYKYKSWKQTLKAMVGDILKRKDISLALERLSEYYLIKRKKINDPFDIFDFLMDKSEVLGIKSRFYFMSGGITKYDNKYKIDEPKSLELINKITKRGHIIGIHPSYNAYNDNAQFKKELDFLEKITEVKITEGREHYLRFEVPTTWQIWEDNGLKVDSTCGYADKEGFRCGTGNEFSVFNILTRQKLNLKERPLVYMDGTIFDYQQYSNLELDDLFNKITNDSIKTILWHNSYINRFDFYSQIINTYKEKYEKR